MSLVFLTLLTVLNAFMLSTMYMLMTGPHLATQNMATGEWERLKPRYRIGIVGSFLIWLLVTGKAVEQLWQHLHG